MPFSGNAWDDSKMVPYRAALRTILQRFPDLRPLAPRPNDTARVSPSSGRQSTRVMTLPFVYGPHIVCTMQVWQVPGHAGTVGFIASMTQHFCASCNRLRLTADGNLKVANHNDRTASAKYQ